MKRKLLLIISTAVIAVCIAGLLLTACESKLTGADLLGFNADDVNKIIIVNPDKVEKVMTAKKAEIFAAVSDMELKKNTEKKYEYQWNIDYGYIIKFYVNGTQGCYSLYVNHGARAEDGFKLSGSKTGFYDFKDKTAVYNAISDIFYL